MSFLERAPAAGLLVMAILLAQVQPGLMISKECGGETNGVCGEGTRCSSGVCLPIGTNSTRVTVTEVKGYGRPMAPAPDLKDLESSATADEQVHVFDVCEHADFNGACIGMLIYCNQCYSFSSDWQYVISSIRITDSRVGCNFWVNTNCQGDGINVPYSNPIYNLGATNYNDRITAFNWYIA